jgi:hypothetical protein
MTFAPSDWSGLRAYRRSRDGEHLILGAGRDEHQLWLPDPPPAGHPLAAIIPIDQLTPGRIVATQRFLRAIKAQRPGAGTKQNPRVVNTLRALDGHLSGASYRVIAECIFGRSRVCAEPWKTSSIRDATIRLVRSGVALMRGGYRKFLRK